MPRHSKAHEKALGKQTLVIDNGAYTIKAGFVTDSPDTETDCQVIPNCIAKGHGSKTWIGAQLDACTDFAEMSFRRPVQKGYLVNWEAEKAIWDKSFFENGAKLQVKRAHEGARTKIEEKLLISR
jgi:actin-related protein 6